jgi:hypothetical protein
MPNIKSFQSLSTDYVNLAGLIRHLRESQFAGQLHFVSVSYEAAVQMRGSDLPIVLERSAGEFTAAAGALERLLVHAREPGGTITIYEPDEQDQPDEQNTPSASAHDDTVTTPFDIPLPEPASVAVTDWADLLDAAGKLIAGVERAVEFGGSSFESFFRTARIELGDDYPFLDPTSREMDYAEKRVILTEHPASATFVSGISECLRRVVNASAVGKENKRFRETVAIELAVAARMRANGLSDFNSQLDKIAGTRVL